MCHYSQVSQYRPKHLHVTIKSNENESNTGSVLERRKPRPRERVCLLWDLCVVRCSGSADGGSAGRIGMSRKRKREAAGPVVMRIPVALVRIARIVLVILVGCFVEADARHRGRLTVSSVDEAQGIAVRHIPKTTKIK
jgi:hypothetical protein